MNSLKQNKKLIDELTESLLYEGMAGEVISKLPADVKKILVPKFFSGQSDVEKLTSPLKAKQAARAGMSIVMFGSDGFLGLLVKTAKAWKLHTAESLKMGKNPEEIAPYAVPNLISKPETLYSIGKDVEAVKKAEKRQDTKEYAGAEKTKKELQKMREAASKMLNKNMVSIVRKVMEKAVAGIDQAFVDDAVKNGRDAPAVRKFAKTVENVVDVIGRLRGDTSASEVINGFFSVEADIKREPGESYASYSGRQEAEIQRRLKLPMNQQVMMAVRRAVDKIMNGEDIRY